MFETNIAPGTGVPQPEKRRDKETEPVQFELRNTTIEKVTVQDPDEPQGKGAYYLYRVTGRETLTGLERTVDVVSFVTDFTNEPIEPVSEQSAKEVIEGKRKLKPIASDNMLPDEAIQALLHNDPHPDVTIRSLPSGKRYQAMIKPRKVIH